MRVLVAVEPIDFRRGIDGLARVCRESLASDPFSGAAFVFRIRSVLPVADCERGARYG
jgi:transposase